MSLLSRINGRTIFSYAVYADEPTGNLDAGSSENVAAMLALAASKYRQTIIMVTHDKQMAGYADRVLSIVDGNVSSEVNV